MSEYIGKICPYCKTRLEKEDDIVVCNVCDMPHHKECWVQNQGCTTFGCTGTMRGVSEPGLASPTDAAGTPPGGASRENGDDSVFCTSCGNRHPAGDRFCSRCGTPLVTNPGAVRQPAAGAPGGTAPGRTAPPDAGNGWNAGSPGANRGESAAGGAASGGYGSGGASGGGYAGGGSSGNGYGYGGYGYGNAGGAGAPDWRESYYGGADAAYIQTNIDYYRKKFSNIRASGSAAQWNWPAFLLGNYWLIYRKMYALGFGLTAAGFFLAQLGSVGWLLGFCMAVTCGILGNYLYMRHVEKMTRDGDRMQEPARSHHRKLYGGTNAAAAVVTLLVYAAINLILMYG